MLGYVRNSGVWCNERPAPSAQQHLYLNRLLNMQALLLTVNWELEQSLMRMPLFLCLAVAYIPS